MSPRSKQHLFVGPLIHCGEDGTLIAIDRATILVENGKISKIEINPEVVVLSCASTVDYLTVLKPGQFLIPGFLDCHMHAVQLPNLGVGYDKELLDWLETYTFPLEKEYKSDKFSEHIFDSVVKQTLARGTTTACYFASLYTKSSLILGQKVAELGQRAFIGKVNMNVKRSDDYYETTEKSITNVKDFIQSIGDLANPRVKPIITPRFALSCNMELMHALGRIAQEKNLHIQTHISENVHEINAVKEVFKEYPSYAAVYDAAGLLTSKTVLAHGIYLTDDELAILKERCTAVIHCPSSNTCLKSGLCDVQRLRSYGIEVGLGTDVSAGQSASILDAMKAALQVSCHLSILKDNYKALDYKNVFYMATLGGAKALAIADEVGNFVPGKEFDALIVDINENNGLLDNMRKHTLEEMLQRFIYSGDDRNIIHVYVSGRKVK